MFKPGDRVVLASLPRWIDKLPEESRAVIAHCVGLAFPVDEIDANGLVVLDVSAEVDERFGGTMNDIRVEPEYVVAEAEWKARST